VPTLNLAKDATTSPPNLRHDLTLVATPFSIVVLIVAAIAFALMAIGRGQDKETHQAILTELRGLDLNNASLQRDVLRARAGLLENYDPLVDSVVALHRNVAALRSLFSMPETVKADNIERQLDDVQSSIDSDETAVETFKTQNALLQNSLNIFSHALTNLHLSDSGDAHLALDGLDDLGNLMLQYTLQYNPSIADQISSELDTLASRGSASSPYVRLLEIHGRLILSVLPEVRATVGDVQASDTINRAQRLQHDYLDAYGTANVRSQWSRVFLGSVSIFLCAYVVVLVDRLRRQTERLRRRLDFERMRRDVEGCFDENAASEESRLASMENAVQIIRVFFEGSRCGFALIDTNTMTVEQAFGDDFELLSDPARIAEVLSETDIATYRNLQKPDALNFAIDAAYSGSALGLRTSDRLAALCIVEFSHPRLRPSSDEISLLEAAVRLLFQTFDYHRKQDERETLERRLEHAERLQSVGTLASGIAHEFNNILVAILGYAEMILDLLRRRSTTRQYVEEIVKAAQRARLVIDQILALSRTRDYISKPIDLVDVIEDIAPLLQVSLPNGVELQIQDMTSDNVVEGNAVDIQHILMNLSKNAAEAMNGPGVISIALQRVSISSQQVISHGLLPAGQYVVLTVADTGKGIPPSVLPKIFEPFYTTRSKSGGTGLGLAAVHGNVEALGGHINVTSVPGMGTKFEIYMPRSVSKPVPLSQIFEQEQVPLGRGEIVGVVDGDEATLASLEDQVAALGYEPVGFSNWDELTRWLSVANHAVDLVLIDEAIKTEEFSDGDIDRVLHSTPYLFMAEQPEDHGLEPHKVMILRKPVASTTMALAIRSGMQNAPNRQSLMLNASEL
jgi:signal transduction histidine kinase